MNFASRQLLRYLLVYSLTHSLTYVLPQIIIQTINNSLVYGITNVPAKGYVSTIFSCFIAANGIYRYGYYLLYLGTHPLHPSRTIIHSLQLIPRRPFR